MRFGKSRKNGKKSKKSRTTVCIIITAAIFAGFAMTSYAKPKKVVSTA